MPHGPTTGEIRVSANATWLAGPTAHRATRPPQEKEFVQVARPGVEPATYQGRTQRATTTPPII
jgi:hypothetical protein